MHCMRITLSIPESVARRFRASVPQRQRSRLVATLLEKELVKREGSLVQACLEANRDKALEAEIEEWQSFEDGVEG